MTSGKIAVVERRNRDAIHALFNTRERAELYLKETVPKYVERGYYTDKSLTADSFEVRELVVDGVLVPAEGPVGVKSIRNTKRAVCLLVGGDYRSRPIVLRGLSLVSVFNQDGAQHGMPKNPHYHDLHGNVFITAEEGDSLRSLTVEEREAVLSTFQRRKVGV